MSFYIKKENRLFCFHNLQGQNYRWKSIIKLYVFRSSFVLYCFLNSKGSWSVRIILGGRLLVLKTAEEWWRMVKVVVIMSGGWYGSVTNTGGCWCVWPSWWCRVGRPGVHRYLTELFPHWLREGTMEANLKWEIVATWYHNQGGWGAIGCWWGQHHFSPLRKEGPS